MGTQHTKLKICLYEKFASLTIVTWTIIVTYTTYYYATIKIQNCYGSILKSTTIYLPLKKKYLRITTKGLPTIDDTI